MSSTIADKPRDVCASVLLQNKGEVAEVIFLLRAIHFLL